MEVILGNLSMDATAGKLKAITDACDEGLEALSKERIGKLVEPYELREKCLLPLKLALESRVSKLSSHALGGFHKLISDERFQSLVEGDVHRQLPVQFVNAVVSTPSMSDEIQVEIMKMLLMITCSASCEVHGEYLIKIAEVCIETYIRSNQSWTKTACRATLTQMLSSVCNDLEESLKKEMLSQHTKESPHSVRGLDLISTDSSKILTQDVLMLLKHFCSRLSPNQSGNIQMNDVLPLYLEAVYVIVSSLSIAIRQERDFINVLWQYLCPTLIHLLASPVSEVGLRHKSQNNYPEDGGRGGRSAGSPVKAKPALQSVARIIYTISKELIRLVGPLSAMRPVLESLFHRIILYPPPQHRAEALKAINDIFASPSHVVDVAGPVILDPDNPPSPDSPTEQKKSEVDLLKVLLDGIVECSHCPDLSVVSGSVACIVALLGSLEELSQGEGLSQGQLELLNKLQDVDGWHKVEENNYSKVPEDSPQTIPKFTLADEPFDECDHSEQSHGKPKHIRWEMDEEPRTISGHKQMQLTLNQMDLETVTQRFANSDRLWDISRTNPDGREQDVPEELNLLGHPKSVHFASDLEEEFTIESREDQRLGRYGNTHRAGVPRRAGLPRRIASSPGRSPVRRSASLDGKSRVRPVVQTGDRRRVNPDNTQLKISRNDRDKLRSHLHRSNSDLGNSPTDEPEFIGHPDDSLDGGLKYSGKDRRQGGSRSILRKPKHVSEFPDQIDAGGKAAKPKGILLNSHLSDLANKKHHGVVKINGILISRSRDSRVQVSPEKTVSAPEKVMEKRKSVEENEKEGARNFARCLLGILPSVLSLHDPVAVDEALQQFASDVCEAVTCMALKRKNVPNFGTLRGSSDLLDDTSGKGATSYLHYPILNADGVYAAVYATLKLNLKLHRAGYYRKKQEHELVTQEEFVQNTHNCGVDVGLSSVWLGELYRLVTTYDILEKAGYKADDVSSNRALIELLSDNSRITRSSEETTTDEAMFIRVHDQTSMTITQKQGVKFVRRILLLTWDSLLEVLRVPIESPLIGTVNESIGMALMMASEGKKHHNKERDTICLSLDGLRRIARLFCTLGIQTGCETVLSQLANASCGGEKGLGTIPKSKAGHSKSRMKLHAAHVLTMDALLAVGLELGSHAPKCWNHVFRCCSYIAGLQNAQFLGENSDTHSSHKVVEVSSPVSETSTNSDFVSADLSSDGSASDIVRQHHNGTPDTTGVLCATDASRAIYALSTSVDRLFEQAANTLSSDAIVAMLESLADASADQLENQYSGSLTYDPRVVTLGNAPLPSNLHFCRMVDMMLRCTRDGKRPLLHLMRAWAKFSNHFVKISCDSKKSIFKFTLDLLKDALVVLLNNRNELPHFWFHETLFKPFESILLSGTINDADQQEVLNTLCELVQTNAGNIKSGWRAICCATRVIRMSTQPTHLVTTELELPIPRILEIVSSFVENRTALVFSQAAVDCILCLSKCLHVLPGVDDASDERSFHGSETESNFSESPYCDMCVPALELLSKISKKLALIHVKPANVIFHGSHAVKLDNSSSPLSSPSSPLMSVADTMKHPGSSLAPNYAHSITAMDDSGILRVWYLVLDVLTTTVITCPRKYQLQALDTLFEVLQSICSVPGPQFSILALTHLLLPMLHAWLEKGIQNPAYWDRTAGNFKQACGLTTELVVGEMAQFLNDQGACECVPKLMQQVLDLLKIAVSQPQEVIARVGCSCFRHLLMSGGALFTEEIWKIICEGLRAAMRATSAPVKLLIPCYQAGSSSVSGDDGCRVRVLTRRDASWEQTIRHGQLAEQVFLLESQLQEEFDRSDDEFPVNEDNEQRSFFFVISSDSQDSPEETTRVPLRGLVVGLLSHQLLLQSLGLLLLDNHDYSFAIPHNPPSKPDDQLDSAMPGLLNHLSPANLSIIFDCLMESHTVAYEFNNRFGLRSLIQMIVRLCAPANLLRQSTMAFKFYLQTLLEICRYNGEHMSGSSVKRILIGDRSLSPEGETSPWIPEASALPADGNGHVTEDKDAEWIVRRLSEACSQLSSVYNRLYNNYNGNEEIERNLTSTPVSSPAKLRSHFGDDSVGSIQRKVDSPDILKSEAFCSKDQQHLQVKKDDDLLQLKTWTAMAVDMIEALLHLPTLQFKPILPAIYPAIASMIPVTGDPKVCRLIYDIVMRVGSIYGII